MPKNQLLTVPSPKLSRPDLLRAVRMDENSDPDDLAELDRMIREAEKIACPKALYRQVPIESRDEKGITAGGIYLRSALISRNVQNSGKIVPFVATCGMEAENWSRQYAEDPLLTFWADAIKMQLLAIIRQEFSRTGAACFPAGKTSAMSPGSLPAWPLPEQRTLFALLGDVTGEIGVILTKSCLMLPAKSNSGILFASKTHFVNCQHCPMPHCPGRRAPFQYEIEGESYVHT